MMYRACLWASGLIWPYHLDTRTVVDADQYMIEATVANGMPLSTIFVTAVGRRS